MPTLERLLAGRHPVVGVVSQPDRPRGRGRRTEPSAVSRAAQLAGVPLLRPERVGGPEVAAELRRLAPDLGVVVAFGQFLPKRIRELPRLGYLINAHASLLPRHRGAAPIQRAILAGDAKTGVSVMRVEREMDAGPVALVRELAIGPEETAGELAQRIAALGAEAVAEVVEQIAAGRVRWTPQPERGVTLAPKLVAADAGLDFREGAAALVRRVRALAPSPGASTRIDGRAARASWRRARRSDPSTRSPVRCGAGPTRCCASPPATAGWCRSWCSAPADARSRSTRSCADGRFATGQSSVRG